MYKLYTRPTSSHLNHITSAEYVPSSSSRPEWKSSTLLPHICWDDTLCRGRIWPRASFAERTDVHTYFTPLLDNQTGESAPPDFQTFLHTHTPSVSCERRFHTDTQTHCTDCSRHPPPTYIAMVVRMAVSSRLCVGMRQVQKWQRAVDMVLSR